VADTHTPSKRRLLAAACSALGAALVLPAWAQQAPAQAAPPRPGGVIFENVRIFDGLADTLSAPANVVVVGKQIKTISSSTIADPADASVTRIAGGGRTLMPGLIDAHTHMMFATVPQLTLLTADIGFINIAAGKGATEMLMRGFTSVPNLGGPVFGLKLAIDAGVLPGPRIWPAGGMISQSGGHGDFRLPTELPARPGDVP
jgi:imidazolonepropionase-like amidohydrolase